MVALVASVPAWIVKHPPLQDMPFHYATLRVIHDFSDPTYAFRNFYTLDLLHTQYVLYYLVGHVLAFVLGVKIANVAMICLYLAGTPIALRFLLRALGRDERLAMLVIPLLVNPMFMLGLLPFVFGIPVMFVALTAAIRWIDEPTPARGVILGVLAIATFYAHVLPFALFGLGFIGVFPWTRPKRWIRAGLPVVPSLIVVVLWLTTSDAGKGSLGGLGGGKQVPLALEAALPGFFTWSVNVFRDSSDELFFVLVCATVLVLVALAASERPTEATTDPNGAPAVGPGLRAYVILPLACLALYFTTGENLGEVWLFSQRFPVPFLMSLVPLVPMPREAHRRSVATAVMAVVACASTMNTARHFVEFETKEVGDIDEAIATIPKGQRVVGLIYDKFSTVVPHAPFLHYVSRYQAEKGGMVLFSYAHFKHWPFHYLPGKVPPPGHVRERWEWMPEAVPIEELAGAYDFVLTRGPGFHPPPGTFHPTFRGARWTVWEKDGPGR